MKLSRITEQNKAKAPNENKPNYRKIFSQITEFKQKVLYLQRISIKKDVTMYKKRILDKLLERKLKGCGAVLLEGPKWCGKTTTCEQQAKSTLYMSDPEHKSQYLRLADII